MAASSRMRVPRTWGLTGVILGLVVSVAGCGSGGGSAARPPSTVPPTTAAPPSTTAPLPADRGSWGLVAAGPTIPTRPVAWTGTEVLVAGMGCCGEVGTADLAAYDPATGTWRKLPATPLTPRSNAAGAWTGREMVVAGGNASPTGTANEAKPVADGAAWNAATGTWHAIAAMPATLPGNTEPFAVWTGREVLVWSAATSSAPAVGVSRASETVLAYDPGTDRWRRLAASGLSPREHPLTVWTGKELVVWGGGTYRTAADGVTTWEPATDGARLDPASGTWRPLPAAPVAARGMATGVWSGREVLLWGGLTAGGTEVGAGAAYDPERDTWRALAASPLRARVQAASVWTGRFFVVIGGSADGKIPVPGPGAAAYDPATDAWTALPAAPAYPALGEDVGPAVATTADQRADGLAVWTGAAVVLVGGFDYTMQGSRPDGLMWTPAARPTS